jgi:hypothetical protein
MGGSEVSLPAARPATAIRRALLAPSLAARARAYLSQDADSQTITAHTKKARYSFTAPVDRLYTFRLRAVIGAGHASRWSTSTLGTAT